MAAPVVNLNTPVNTLNISDTTPDLVFTGTDADSDAVEYEVQVSTDSLFPPVAGTNLTSFQDSTDATSYATASITPTANYLILASVTSSKGSTPDTPTLSGNGLTWVQYNQIAYDTAGTQRTTTFFRAMGASPSAGALTADFGGATQTACVIVVDQFSGVDTSGTNGSGAIVQSVTGTEYVVDTLTITLAAFSSANNATYGVASNGDSGNYTAGSGFTQLGASGSATPLINTISQFRNDNDTSATFTGTALWTMGGIAVEIKAATLVVDAVSGTDAGFVGTGGTPTFANLTSGSSNANGPWNTASVTPTANKLQLLSVYLRNGSSVNPTISTVTGNGLTWVLAQSINFDTASTSRRTLEIWRSMGASPSTGAITITPTETETGAIWSLEEVIGVDISGTNGSGAIVQSATNKDEAPASGVITATLSAFGSSKNATFGVFANDVGSDTVTAGTGFSKLADVGSTDANISSRFTTEYKSSNDTSVDVTFSAIPGVMGVVALEIKSASPFESGTATTYTVQSALSNSTVYYWRVRAVDPSGGNVYGNWSETRSFNITDNVGLGWIKA